MSLYRIKRDQEINEGAKTVVHNLWTRLAAGSGHGLGTKHLGSVPGTATGGLFGLKTLAYIADVGNKLNKAAAQGDLLLADQITKNATGSVLAGGVFTALPITLGLILKIGNFIDNIDDAYFNHHYKITEPLSKKIIKWCSQIKTAVPVKLERLNNKKWYQFGKDAFARRNTKKATPGIGNGVLTTSTAYKKLYIDNRYPEKGCYIVYFTFDEDSIINAKVLCIKPNSDPTEDNSYYVTDIPQWNSVNPAEYKK